jgi:hypothetical protein
MPTVKDEQGNVIAKMPYNEAGEEAAEKMVEDNLNLEIDYGQNNVTDASLMREQMYAGGGKTGYNAIGNPMYDKGGKAERYKESVTAETPSEKRAKIKKIRQSSRRVRKSARAYQKDLRTSGDLTRNERKDIKDIRRTSRKEARRNVKSIRKTGMTLGSKEVYKALKSDKFRK